MRLLANRKKIHFIGIGGIGMSSLAQLLIKLGYKVSGSDLKRSRLIKKLEDMGAEIYIGHAMSNLKDVDLVVYSSCISLDNPELIAVKDKSIPFVQRAQMLAQLMKGKIGIAVTGTHGKTTTTALISCILYVSGLKPSVCVGAEVSSLGGNACLGDGKYFVAEADESDGSFLHLAPTYSVITNIEREHLDFYESLDEIIEAYSQFAKKTRNQGCLFAYADDKNVKRILSNYRNEFLTFGLKRSCDIRACNVKIEGLHSEFDCIYKDKYLGSFSLNIPGRHNVINSLAAILVALRIGIKVDDIKKGLLSYDGAERRFQIKGEVNNITIIEDYAHHPTEIKATLEAAFNLESERVVVVFQPHRYTRTKYLKSSFSSSLLDADYLILTDIYSASEDPIEGITTKIIYKSLVKKGHKSVRLVPRNEVAVHLARIVKPRDIVLVMGAGDIGEVSDELVQKLKKQSTH